MRKAMQKQISKISSSQRNFQIRLDLIRPWFLIYDHTRHMNGQYVKWLLTCNCYSGKWTPHRLWNRMQKRSEARISKTSCNILFDCWNDSHMRYNIYWWVFKRVESRSRLLFVGHGQQLGYKSESARIIG